MPLVLDGDDCAVMKNQSDSPDIKRMDNDFFEIAYTFVSLRTTAIDQLPELGVEIEPDAPRYEAAFEGHQVIDAFISAHSSPAHVFINVVYGSPNRVKFNTDTNFERREITTGILEKPIESHPSFNDGTWNAAQKEQIIELGIESYVVAAPIYRRTTRPSSFAWTQDNVKENVGKREAPTSLGGAVADNWLKMQRNVTDDEKTIEMVEEWQFSDDWDTGDLDIYEEVT